MRKLLAKGKIATYKKGEIVVRLIEQEDVVEEEALIAASRCNDVESAIELLAQECQLCMNVMKMTEVKKEKTKKFDCFHFSKIFSMFFFFDFV